MKKIFLISCISLFSNAQTVVYHDTFDDDKNEWTARSSKEMTVKIEKGKLILDNTGAVEKWELFKAVEKPDETDFDVEATMEVLKSGSDYSRYGLVWSCYNNHKYYEVTGLTPKYQVELYRFEDGTNEYSLERTNQFADAVKSYKSANKILVQKRGNITRTYINGKLIHQTGENKYYGSKAGFILQGKMKIAIDEIKITTYPMSIKVVASFDPNLKLEKLPATISNPDVGENNPVISADGATMYIARGDYERNIDTKLTDIWVSSKDANGNWTELQNIGRPLNNKSYNFVISVSPDNNTLLLANRYTADGQPNGQGLSITKRTASGWEIPQDIVIENYKNKNKYVGYFLSADNKHLLMSVEREDGMGIKDLYVSFLKEDGTWSSPLNLGSTINTFEDETNPFLAADGKTLYFASKGHIGYGGWDIFVSKRLDDTWTNWSEPENLGNIINSQRDELSIFLSAKGDKAYVARGGDIYEVTNTVKQDPVVLIKGRVFDNKTKAVMSAPIVYNDLKTNRELGTAISDPSTGSYSIVLPYGTHYSFMAQKQGYYAVTENIDVSSLTQYKEITVDLYLNPIEKGQTIRLNNIFFDSAKFDLLSESFAELDRLHKVLTDNPSLKIEIAGHTDAVGSDDNNLLLSKNRANAVMNYLKDKGIASERLTAKGYGETKFIAPNDTEEGRQLNRRVEFSIIEM